MVNGGCGGATWLPDIAREPSVAFSLSRLSVSLSSQLKFHKFFQTRSYHKAKKQSRAMFVSVPLFLQKSATGNVMERGMYKVYFSK